MAKKKPLSPEGLEAIVDGFLGAAARGDIRIGSWPVQGVERRLKSLELMIESCCHPNIKLYKKEYVDIAPGKVRIVAGARTKNPLWKATEDDIGNL